MERHVDKISAARYLSQLFLRDHFILRQYYHPSLLDVYHFRTL